jgi:predicted kinase
VTLLDFCPTAPDWSIDWDRLRACYPVIAQLDSCPQDPGFHSEGDVGIHTRMVCDALAGSSRFRDLPASDRAIAFAAAVLHDIGKPACTREQDGRLRSRGHSPRGESMARQLLWRERVPFAVRELVCALVRYHQMPFFLLDRDDSARLVDRISQVARCDLLSLVAWADGTGRRCADAGDQRRILDNVDLFRDYCAERGCLTEPRSFPSDHSRFLYFRKEDRDPHYHAFDDTRSLVTVMSGLPGAGKSHWIRHNAAGLPLVSLDAIRDQLGIDAADQQGRVVDRARERARELLRDGTAFVWNATNLSRQLREQVIDLFASYNARVRIVYVEAPEQVIRERNRRRDRPVPDRVIDKLLDRWSVPAPWEAHELIHEIE